MKKCFRCHAPVADGKVSFKDECPSCRSDLHVCVNCLFYDTGKHNSCREPQADYVKEKDRANFCEYFRFKDDDEQRSDRDEAAKKWEALFKKR
ncbi:MAG TPA: hypothetical protein PLX02_00445 [Syntrophorhabdaceae bacterium]|nr:hypothetical protein [Syntrophorhabdaceae bacterium]HQM80067.1 hypothetical protein [Syntrophorhabdaceae bacterium]